MFLPRLVFFVLWLTIRESLVSSQDCECGVGNEDQIDFRIINGQEVFPHAYPWLVYLTYGARQMYCGGAIINDRYVLTAGHCVYNLQPSKITVFMGAHDLKVNRGKAMAVDYYKLHPEFTRYRDYDDNDIALIRLQEKIIYNHLINPICLPIAGNYNKDIATIAGWGITESKVISNILLFAKVRVLPDAVCARSNEVGNMFRPGENLCAYGFKTDTCQGDSGSPLIHEIRPYKYQALGVVSWGHGCAPMGIPGIYVNVLNYVPWILKTTRDAHYCRR